MGVYVGISLIILSLSILVFVIGLFGYIVHISKKEFDATPNKASNSSTTEERT